MGPEIWGIVEMIIFIQQKSPFIVCYPVLGKLNAVHSDLEDVDSPRDD